MTVKVTVTNTGDRAGKDVVQLYYTAPYITGEIEKSSVELAAFAKTKELQPGESEEVTLTVPVEKMASYDAYDANHNALPGMSWMPVTISLPCATMPTPWTMPRRQR